MIPLVRRLVVFLCPFLRQERGGEDVREYYTVTKDADILAPSWLSERIERGIASILYRTRDGHAEVKGVRVKGDEVAQIGDTIMFNGRRISVERR